MKKIFFIFILLLSFFGIDSAFSAVGDSVFYYKNSDQKIYTTLTNTTSDGTKVIDTQYAFPLSVSTDGTKLLYNLNNRLYIKNSNDNSIGTSLLPNTTVIHAVFDATGDYIYYSTSGIGNQIYKKSSSDSNIGVSIFPSVWVGDYFSISPNGSKMIYVNINDGYRLYVRDTEMGGTGTLLVSGSVPVFDVDGEHFFYKNSDQKMYYKSIYNTDVGIQLTSDDIGSRFSISPNGNYIAYINTSQGSKIYLKDRNYGNGTPLTISSAGYPIFNGRYILQTCHDGIKNQDETAIDFGGVCGTGNVSYDSFGCINQSFVNPSDITWYSGLYAGTGSLVNPPIFTGSISAYYGTGANHDILMIHDYPFNISAPDDKAFEYGLGRETYFEGGNIRTWSVRGGTDQQFNAVAIYGTGTAGRGVFKHSTDNSNMFTTVGTSFNGSGAVYWIDSTALSNVFDGYYVGTVTGMRLGKTNTFINKKSCKNASYSCEWKQIGNTSFSCIYPYAYDLSDSENNLKCGIDNSGSCVPVSSTGFALPGQTTITTASGEVISSSWDAPSSSKISAIFSCDKDNNLETTWQEYLTCITTIIDNAIEYVQKTQDETTKITSGVVLTKTGTSNPFDKGQVSTNNMLSALKGKAETQLVGDTKTSIFVKIFYWFAILLSIVMALLLFKKEK